MGVVIACILIQCILLVGMLHLRKTVYNLQTEMVALQKAFLQHIKDWARGINNYTPDPDDDNH